MNTAMTYQIDSSSSGATFAIGEQFGAKCRGGEVFVLSSDLGGGKTTFTKGLAKGLGVDSTVTSPTFTISRVHSGRNNLELRHYDFYRLQDPGILALELAEIVDDDSAVCVIEWGDIVDSVLPPDCISILIARSAESEDTRKLHITLPESKKYLQSGSA